MGGIGTATAKLLLFGEHAAVHGHPAVGIALPEATTVVLEDAPGGWDLTPVAAVDRDSVRGLVDRLVPLLPGLATRPACRVRIHSSVARGIGFGSSAALCGAFARAVISHAGGSGGAPAEEEWRLAHEAEHLFHGTPSGIDTGLALAPGMCAFTPRPPLLPARTPLAGPPLHLVVAAVPRAEGCGALVAAVARRVKAGDQAAGRAIESLGQLASETRDLLQGTAPGGPVGVGALADQAMEILRGLGLGTPWLEQLLGAGRAAGALGGKLSGAGGGGAFYLVAADEPSARAIAARVRAAADASVIPLVSPPRIVTT